MQGHYADLLLGVLFIVVHHQADVFEEALQVLEILQRLHQFLEVLQTARAIRVLVHLPHGGIAAFVQDDLGQLHMTDVGIACHPTPAAQILGQLTQRSAALALDLTAVDGQPCPFEQRNAILARRDLDLLLCLVAKAPLGRVDNALKGQIVLRRDHQPEIGHSVANLEPLVESRPANHPVGQTDGQETVLKGAHLVAGAHQNRHLVQIHRILPTGAALHGFDLFPDPARFFFTIPMADQPHLFAASCLGPQLLAQTPCIAPDHAGGRRKDMLGRAVILL